MPGLLNISKDFIFSQARSDRDPPKKKEEMFKNARPARPQLLGRAERTEEYVSKGKEREHSWRHFSTFPCWICCPYTPC
jgi:hypothetical protein